MLLRGKKRNVFFDMLNEIHSIDGRPEKNRGEKRGGHITSCQDSGKITS